MEKTLTIDGKHVTFKSTGAFLLRYKAQFGRDALGDLMKMAKASEDIENTTELSTLDLTPFLHIIWTLAKTADPSIPDPFAWLDSFDEFPLLEILPELQDMVTATLQGSKKK
jgi:hypothetical protein